jgi:hypothetical protein
MSELSETHASSLLSEAREELDRADSKASIILAAVGVAAGLLFSNAIGGSWKPNALPPLARSIWWATSVVGVVGVLCLGRAVFPVTRRRDGPAGSIRYFGDVAKLATPAEVRKMLPTAADDPLERTLDQVWILSRIVMEKYHYIRWGMCLVGVALGGYLLALAVS